MRIVARRTEDFDIGPNMPELVRGGWGAVPEFFRTVRRAKGTLSIELAKLRSDKDLNEDAVKRKTDELYKRLSDEVEPAWSTFQAELAKVRSQLNAAVERAHGQDPFEPKPVDLGSLPEDQRASARASLEAARQSARVARLLVEQKVDRAIDRALASGNADVALCSLYESAAKAGDAEFLHVFEREGMARIGLEGSEAQRTALSLTIEGSREARLPDAAKLLLDHRDAFGEAEMMASAVIGDARAPERFLGGNSPALTAATAYLGSRLSGEE